MSPPDYLRESKHDLKIRLDRAIATREDVIRDLRNVNSEIRAVKRLLSTQRKPTRQGKDCTRTPSVGTRDIGTSSAASRSALATRCSSRGVLPKTMVEKRDIVASEESQTQNSQPMNHNDSQWQPQPDPTISAVDISYLIPSAEPFERWMHFVTRFSDRPTRPMTVVPKVEDEPRAAHLLPLVPGRLVEGIEKDSSMKFNYRLFKKKGIRDVSRYMNKGEVSPTDPLIAALFVESQTSSSCSSDCD